MDRCRTCKHWTRSVAKATEDAPEPQPLMDGECKNRKVFDLETPWNTVPEDAPKKGAVMSMRHRSLASQWQMKAPINRRSCFIVAYTHEDFGCVRHAEKTED